MSIQNFPNGIASFGVPIIGGGQIPATTGKYWFVDSVNGSNSNTGKTPKKAVATIDYAIGLCTASNGDVIVVMPGYTQTISASSGILADIAGVTIYGMGAGTLRPTITFGAAAADIDVSAANVTFDNFIFVANFDNVAAAVTVAAKDCTIKNSEFRDTSDALHFVNCVATSATNNAADGLAILDCTRNSLALAASALVTILANNDRVRVQRNYLFMEGLTSDLPICLLCGAFITKQLIATDNICIAPAQTGIAGGQFGTGSATASTGVMARNFVMSSDTTGGLFITAAWVNFGLYENYQTGAPASSGTVYPAADNPGG